MPIELITKMLRHTSVATKEKYHTRIRSEVAFEQFERIEPITLFDGSILHRRFIKTNIFSLHSIRSSNMRSISYTPILF